MNSFYTSPVVETTGYDWKLSFGFWNLEFGIWDFNIGISISTAF